LRRWDAALRLPASVHCRSSRKETVAPIGRRRPEAKIDRVWIHFPVGRGPEWEKKRASRWRSFSLVQEVIVALRNIRRGKMRRAGREEEKLHCSGVFQL